MTDLRNAERLLASGYSLTLAGAARVVRDMHEEARELEDQAHEATGDEQFAQLSRAHSLRSWARRSESFYSLSAAVRIAEALRNDETPTEAGVRPSHHEEKQ